MYPHSPSGEYRLLLLTTDEVDEVEPGACHVFELGSCQPPRDIGYEWPNLGHDLLASEVVLFRGGLHWHLDERESGSNVVMMFDTTAESFRQMRSAIPGGHGVLFEMDGMLAMCTFDDAPAKVIDIWVLKDYESEAWAFKCRVGLPVEEFKVQFEMLHYYWTNVAMSCDGDLLFLVASRKWLLQVDIDGKVVASSRRDHLYPTQLRLKQTLVSHTFFLKLEGYVVNAPPFF
jgi:F-box interacting protein